MRSHIAYPHDRHTACGRRVGWWRPTVRSERGWDAGWLARHGDFCGECVHSVMLDVSVGAVGRLWDPDEMTGVELADEDADFGKYDNA